MAQPAQAIWGPSGEYNVIDNGPAPAATVLDFGKAPVGYDTTTGAIAQSTNAFKNGTIPDSANPVAVSPNIAAIIQKASGSSSGSVASLATAFGSNNVAGNSIVVVCGVGNGTAPTISDTKLNTYTQVVQVANGAAFNVAIFVATNVGVGANTVTVNNGGTTASIAMEIYEVSNFVTVSNAAAVDNTASNTSGAATASPAVTVTPLQTNELSFAAFGLGTAAQTITVGGSYANDSGQLNPTTPAGLFSFASGSLGISASASPSGTVGVAEPWAVAAATFKTTVPVAALASGKVILNSSQTTRLVFKNPA